MIVGWLTSEEFSDFAAMPGVEFLMIDEQPRVGAFRDQVRWNDRSSHRFARGL